MRVVAVRNKCYEQLVAVISSVPETIDPQGMLAWAKENDVPIAQISSYALSSLGGRTSVSTMIVRKKEESGETSNLYLVEIEAEPAREKIVVRPCVATIGSDPRSKEFPGAIGETVSTEEVCFVVVDLNIMKGSIKIPLEIRWENLEQYCADCASLPEMGAIITLTRQAGASDWRIVD